MHIILENNESLSFREMCPHRGIRCIPRKDAFANASIMLGQFFAGKKVHSTECSHVPQLLGSASSCNSCSCARYYNTESMNNPYLNLQDKPIKQYS